MGELSSSAIDGVVVSQLKEIEDERGAVLHIMRCDSPLFSGFGEVYCSLTLPGVVKAWKRHRRQTQHFAVPQGLMKVVLFDARHDSPTAGTVEKHMLGRPGCYRLLRIPPGLWYGFQAMGETPALIVNLVDMPHQQEEVDRLDLMSGPVEYDWDED